MLPLLLQSFSALTFFLPIKFHPTYSHSIPIATMEANPSLILSPPPHIMLRPYLFHLVPSQSPTGSTLTPPIKRLPTTLPRSIYTLPLRSRPISFHHAPPPHLAPDPAPLRTPVGGGAHGCARGSRGRSLAGSPTPVALETAGGDASYGKEGGEKGLSRRALETPGSPGLGVPPASPHTRMHLASVPLLCFSFSSSVIPGTPPPLRSSQK